MAAQDGSIKNMLEVKNISKSFTGVEVLHSVNFSIREKEVHALIGENGAGKSTLLKIISGVYKADAGEIFINGKPVEINNPAQAHQAGFSIIYQELVLAPNMSVYENILLGNEPSRAGFYDKKKGATLARKYLKMVNAQNVDPLENVCQLSIANQQLVEIARAVARNTKIIAMDEPTSSLTETEIEGLFNLIEELKTAGHSVIYVSHRIEEIFKIADRVTVLRDGNIVETLEVGNCTKQKLINLMAGTEIVQKDKRRKDKDYSRRKKILEVRSVSIPGLLDNINFDLYEGEILGLAGLVGSGRSTLLSAIMGLKGKKVNGEIIFRGENIITNRTDKKITMGFGLVPEDRKVEGLCLNLNMCNNLSLSTLGKISQMGFINFKRETGLARESIERLNIRPSDYTYDTRSLSGGNQQKIVLGKWLALKGLNVFLLDEPTRGIDVRTKFFIHKFIKDLAEKGMSIIVASSELPEILELSDRILVMKNGRIEKELKRSESSKEKILEYAF